jgi:hypothetical protein
VGQWHLYGNRDIDACSTIAYNPILAGSDVPLVHPKGCAVDWLSLYDIVLYMALVADSDYGQDHNIYHCEWHRTFGC